MRTIFHEGFKIFFYALNTAKYGYINRISPKETRNPCVYIFLVFFGRNIIVGVVLHYFFVGNVL